MGLFADPVTMSLRDLVRQMVVLSDSIAARVLQRRLPPGLVGEVHEHQVLQILMILGRLEILTAYVLFTANFWRG